MAKISFHIISNSFNVFYRECEQIIKNLQIPICQATSQVKYIYTMSSNFRNIATGLFLNVFIETVMKLDIIFN